MAALAALFTVSGCTVTTNGGEPTKSTTADPAAAASYHGPPLTTDKVAPVSALAGGMPIYVGSGPDPARCTAGFPLVGTGGIRYYLMAGHCARGEKNAPVFADISKLTDSGQINTSRIQIGKVADNQYPAEYTYDAANPPPFPDLALFTANTKTGPPQRRLWSGLKLQWSRLESCLSASSMRRITGRRGVGRWRRRSATATSAVT